MRKMLAYRYILPLPSTSQSLRSWLCSSIQWGNSWLPSRDECSSLIQGTSFLKESLLTPSNDLQTRFDLPAAVSRHMLIICLWSNDAAFFRRNINRDPPSTSSITIIMGCFWTQMPISLTMLGWSYCFRILPSCKNFRFCSSGSVIRHVLTATSCLVDRSFAL